MITSLTDKDRIFTNLYGFQSWRLDAARAEVERWRALSSSTNLAG